MIETAVIENPTATSTPAPPKRKKKHAAMAVVLTTLSQDEETTEETETVVSVASSPTSLTSTPLETVDEVVDEAVKQLEEPIYTPVTPPRRRLTLQAYPVEEAPSITVPPRPSSPAHSTPPTPSSPIPSTPSSLRLSSAPPRPTYSPTSFSPSPTSPVSTSVPDLPSSPIPPPPYRASRSHASLEKNNSVTVAAPSKEKKEGIFARLFRRTGDAARDGPAQDEPACNNTDVEIVVQDESVENIPKRRWNSLYDDSVTLELPDTTNTQTDTQTDNMTDKLSKILKQRRSKQCLTMEPPKLEQIKKWTVQNYKYTKQLVSEKFGHSTKTVDKELDVRIEELRLSKVQYGNMLREARAMYARFEALVSTHRNIRAQFQTLISHAPELQDQLQANATTQSILEKNGEGLLGAIKTFVDSLNTLVNVTIQDTFLTIKNYENSRVEYDAYRNDIDTLQNGPQTESNKNKLLELQVIFENRRQKWEKLKSDTNTKLDLLGENRSMVMKTQLEMFNSAVIAYFSGNGDKLSEVLAEYHIKTKKISEEGDTTTNSFLARNE